MSPRFFVDRIEGEMATLLAVAPAEGEWILPLAMLPRGVAEGDYLTVALERDAGTGRAARAEIDRLMSSLGDNP